MVHPLAAFVVVDVVNQVRFGVHPRNANVAGVEHFAQFVADEVDDGLEVEFGRHAFLDAVDHGQFRCAPLGLLQEPLRFVEQARALQRHAHRGADGGQ